MARRGHAFRICRLLLMLSTAVAVGLFSSLAQSTAAQASAVDLTGNPVDPLKSSQGKVVVLVFVRTDCPVSNRYAPEIQRLSAQYLDKAAFWLVFPSKAESPEMIRKHEQDFGYKLPALRDLQHALVRHSQVQVTPEVAVFDVHGRLIYHGRIDNLYEDLGRARSAPTTHELDDAIRAATIGKILPARATPAVGCYLSDLE
jgi:thiol-disulfide isomerase/thioredoxin